MSQFLVDIILLLTIAVLVAVFVMTVLLIHLIRMVTEKIERQRSDEEFPGT